MKIISYATFIISLPALAQRNKITPSKTHRVLHISYSNPVLRRLPVDHQKLAKKINLKKIKKKSQKKQLLCKKLLPAAFPVVMT